MIPIVREIRRLLFLVALLVAGCASPAAFGQDEELIDDGPPIAAPAPMLFGMQQGVVQTINPDQVDQWVFSRWGGSAATRARMDANLTLRIDDIDRACSVTEVQKKKLKLAGLGDIKRYFDRVEDLKRRYVRNANSPNNNIWQEMQPLQMELNTGFFGGDSIFVKTIKKTLDDDQAKRYDSLMHRRGLERRRATVEWFVVHIDKALGLTEDERSRLVQLILSETPPPNRYGQGDFWYLMYQMTRVPEAKIKAIVDEPQWRLLSRQFMQARGMEPWLRGNGIIASDTNLTAIEVRQGAIQVRMRNFVAPPVPVAPAAIPKK